MPIYEKCLECDYTIRLKSDLGFIRAGKNVNDCEGFLNEPCLECSNSATEKRKIVRYWLPYIRDDVSEF